MFLKSTTEEISNAFAKSDWKVVVAGLGARLNRDYCEALHLAGKAAEEKGEIAQSEALDLLGRACSMMLTKNEARPFGQKFQTPYGSSQSVEGFGNPELLALKSMLIHIDDDSIHARVADILGIRFKDKIYAQEALEHYRKLPLNSISRIDGSEEIELRIQVLEKIIASGTN